VSIADGRVDSLLRLSKRVVYLAWASCALSLSTSFFSWLELSALRSLDPAAAYSWDVDYIDPTLTLVAGVNVLFYAIVFIVAGFLSLRWIYRANANAHCLNSVLEMSPGWNVGWFFVPIATWWKPYEGLRDVWKISANPQDPSSNERPGMMVAWWTFWVLTNLAGTISFRLQMRASTVGTEILADVFDILGSILFVPATYFFLAVVRDITEKQERFAVGEDGMTTSLSMGPEQSA
jgi:hypothetical protein